MAMSRSARWTAAGVLLVIKAVTAGVVGLALVRATRRHHQKLLGQVIAEQHAALGWLVLALAAASVVMAVAVLQQRSWGRIGTFVLEGVSAVIALTRIPSRPGLALLSILFSAVVVLLLAVEPRSDATAAAPDGSAAAPDPSA
jgi:hypothetical protein